MSTSCATCPLRRLPIFRPFTENELRFMERFKSGELVVDPGTPLLVEGSSAPQLYTTLSGMGLRYKMLSSGRRQVVNFLYPGDFIGLQAGVMGEMRHSVEATTRMRLCVFSRREFWSFVRSQPERAFDITWLAAMEEHFLGEALTSIGQRSAIERVAWALVRVWRRGRSLGMHVDGAMDMPYRQQDLADLLGLSLVHTNKTLAKLRERQMVAWSDGVLRISDVAALARLAEMDIEPEPMRPLI